MSVIIRKYELMDISYMIDIWNQVVQEGNSFPQEEFLNLKTGEKFFLSQSYCGVAHYEKDSKIIGIYILHPNNVGRCSHICNASFAVSLEYRGNHIGRHLVLDCIKSAKNIGFKILQFNAVVSSNVSARHLYEDIGFKQLGTIPNGFRLKSGKYQDICPYYIEL